MDTARNRTPSFGEFLFGAFLVGELLSVCAPPYDMADATMCYVPSQTCFTFPK